MSEKPSENVQPSGDDDDEFGDFEETVPTEKIEQVVEMSPVVDQIHPQMNH